MFKLRKIGLAVVFCCFALIPYSASAKEIFIYTDNDTYFNTDEEYTGGAGAVIDFFGFSLNYHYMLFTPQNTDALSPPTGQRPYAAYEKYGAKYRNNLSLLYFDVGFFGARTGDKLNGEFIQNAVHEEIAEERSEAEDIDPNEIFAHGWPTQISNKTGTQSEYLAGLFHEFGDSFAVLVYGLGESGDFIQSSGYGATSRMGFHIDKFSDNNYAPKNAFFLELDYRALDFSKNNLLEGNESTYPFAVAIEDKVQRASVSLVAVIRGFKLLAGATYITKEYKTQPINDFTSDGHFFGTVGLGYRL